MKLVYIAGPFRGPTPWDVEQNIRRQEEIALKVARLGGVPVCPHTMYRFFNGTINDQFWIDATILLLKQCDIVLVCGDFNSSEGTLNEIKIAVECGIKVFYYDEDPLYKFTEALR